MVHLYLLFRKRSNYYRHRRFGIEKSVNKRCLILIYKIKKLYRHNSGMKIAKLLNPEYLEQNKE